MTKTMAVAIDVGGTKSAVGLVRQDGHVLAWNQRPAQAWRGPEAMIDDYLEMIEEVLRQTGRTTQEVIGIGVGCGGPLDADTGVVYAPPNLPGWDEVPLRATLERAVGLPAWIDNDANAAALAEFTLGAGRGADPLIYLTISTGIGAGVIIDGRIYRGATGNAAELGHTVVQTGGRSCLCGGRGCLEAYCSGTSIANRARAALEEATPGHHPSALHTLGRPPHAEDVVFHARHGDPLAHALWQETMQLLASGIVSAIHAFDPVRVVLGGGVTRAGNDLLVPLREAVRDLTMHGRTGEAEIVLAELGDQVGILGAACVAFSRSEQEKCAV